jgi:hypothetical protein
MKQYKKITFRIWPKNTILEGDIQHPYFSCIKLHGKNGGIETRTDCPNVDWALTNPVTVTSVYTSTSSTGWLGNTTMGTTYYSASLI